MSSLRELLRAMGRVCRRIFFRGDVPLSQRAPGPADRKLKEKLFPMF